MVTRRVTVGAETPDEAVARASQYLEKRGLWGVALRVRKRPSKTGIIDYKVWDVEFELRP